MGPQLHQFKFSTDILRRGFWLYVWRIKLKDGPDLHYVGRTGDSSSLKAQSPFSRVSGHLGPNKNANALRRHLSKRDIDFDVCDTLELITFGPIYPEGANEGEHRDRRNKVHALERDLCEAMKSAGYSVMNTVPCRFKTDPTEWEHVRKNFQTHLSAYAPEPPKQLRRTRRDHEYGEQAEEQDIDARKGDSSSRRRRRCAGMRSAGSTWIAYLRNPQLSVRWRVTCDIRAICPH